MSQPGNQTIDVAIQTGRGEYDPAHLYYELGNTLLPKDTKLFLGNRNNRVCRFCKRDSGQTDFKKIAHVVPEFMGNKKYFSYFECDECNEFFGVYETSLANYGGILNTFSMVKGKNGHPKHKSKIEDVETFVHEGNIVMRIHSPDSNGHAKSVQYDSKTGFMTFNTTKYPYIPMDAFKALTKIGMCLLNEAEMLDYEITRKWLLKETELDTKLNKPLLFVFQKIGGKLFPHPWIAIMKKRPQFLFEPCPTHSVLINYGMFKFQIFLPGNVHDQWMWKGKKLTLAIENHVTSAIPDLNLNVSLGMDMVDFSSPQKLINQKHSFRVPFESTKQTL